MQLYIGNQNYSTWSLRAWSIFVNYDIDVEIVKLRLDTPEFYQEIRSVNPAGTVPVLLDGGLALWESLAILEYVNDAFLEGKAWPSDPAERARARVLACEMHAGFPAMRREMPMNCRARRKVVLSDAAKKDIARVDEIWSRQMTAYPDGWLFGEWSIADAMFAPVALRFMTYNTQLSDSAGEYLQRVLASAPIQRWLVEAALETDIVVADEAGEDV